VKFLDQKIKNKESPHKKTFSFQNRNIDMSEIFKEKMTQKQKEESQVSYETRFKFTSNNIRLIVHERERNLKEKVETMTKDLRKGLISQLEKIDQYTKLRESVFCKKIEKIFDLEKNSVQ